MMKRGLKFKFVTVLLAVLACRVAVAQQYYWSNLAGTPGGGGQLDGTGLAAQFNSPNSVAVASSGDLYVADRGNHTIRKVSAGGVVTTLAGSPGVSGTSDGTGSAAQFSGPCGVTVDASGIVYVADTGNSTIRKVTSDGTVTTLAGSPGQNGCVDGARTAALFGFPTSVAADGFGNVYVADPVNHTIRKVTSAGAVTTFAGAPGQIGSTDGAVSDARFSHPNGVSMDGNGNLYVADTFNHSIRKISPAGVVTTVAGNVSVAGGLDGPSTLATFAFPNGVAADGAGNVYVADTFNHTVRKVSTAGMVMTLAGSVGLTGGADGLGAAARFNMPTGLAADASGNVYVADSCNNGIRKVTGDWGVVTTFAGSIAQTGGANGTGNAARFWSPNGVGVDSTGNAYIADTNTHTIRKVTPAGVVATVVGASGTVGLVNGNGTGAMFNNPYGVAVTSSSNMYVADTFNNVIRKVTYTGANWTSSTIAGLVMTGNGSFGLPGRTDGDGAVAQFSNPSGMAVDSSGVLYVADTYNHTIRQIASTGSTWAVTTLTGTAGASGTSNGIGTAALFSSPFGIAVDSGSNLYVGDFANHTIRKMTLSGSGWAVTTLAGSPGVSGSSDGIGDAARFNNPAGVAVDSGSNVYVADSGNNTIRRISPDGTVVTIGGTPGRPGGVDGVGSAGLFYGPCGIAVDGSGNIYVADSFNNRISFGSCVGSGSASLTTGTAATVSGAANPKGVTSNVYFEYGMSATYGSVTGSQNIGAGTDFVPVSISLIGLTPNTTYHYRLVIVNASGTFYGTDQIVATLPIAIPVITSAVTVTGTNTLPFPGYQIVASNSATSFTASGLPAGLSIHPVTGAISGTATVSGIFAVTLGATNIIGTGTKTLTISIVTMALPTLSSATSVVGTVGCLFSYNITASPYVTSFSATGLPSWMVVDAAKGIISGTPTATGTFAVTIGAGNAAGPSTATLQIIVSGAYRWTNFAGEIWTSGTADGTGSAARFFIPRGVAVDSSGNIYVADTYNYMIRKITPTGVVTTLAGTRISGTADGTGAKAQFNAPIGIAVDSGSNIYVADSSNHSIRKITPAGVVTTLAGLSGSSGSVNGTGTNARFYSPYGIAVDSGSNLYVADTNNHTIRKVTPAGVVTTLAGTAGSSGSADGTGSAARFYSPFGVAVDSAKNVYVGDSNNQTIRKITSGGGVTTLAGKATTSGAVDGAASVARFSGPNGIAVDSGTNLYVAAVGNAGIRKLTASGTVWSVITIGGTPGVSGAAAGTGTSAQFYQPSGVAVSSDGTVYVADTYNYRISVGSVLRSPIITSGLMATGTAGVPFSYTIAGSNSPTSYAASGLPAGLAVSAGTGLLSGTPTISGSFSPLISAANGDGADAQTLTLVIKNTMSAWKSLKFTSAELSNSSISGDTATPAGDGVSNLIKYALNLEPKSPSATALPTTGLITLGGIDYLSLTYAPAPLLSDLTITAEVTGDLQTWNSGPAFTTPVNTGATSTITIRDQTPMSGATKRFIRLKVTKP